MGYSGRRYEEQTKVTSYCSVSCVRRGLNPKKHVAAASSGRLARSFPQPGSKALTAWNPSQCQREHFTQYNELIQTRAETHCIYHRHFSNTSRACPATKARYQTRKSAIRVLRSSFGQFDEFAAQPLHAELVRIATSPENVYRHR